MRVIRFWILNFNKLNHVKQIEFIFEIVIYLNTDMGYKKIDLYIS